LSFQKTIKEFDSYSAGFNVEFQGVNIWPYLRFYSLDKLHFKTDRKAKVGGKKAAGLIKNLFYGFRFWFGKFESIVFMASSDRRLYNGKWTEKTDFLPQYIGNTLFVELPNKGHFPIEEIPNKQVSSKVFLLLLEKIVEKFISTPNEVLEIQSEIEKKYSIEANLSSIYKQFAARYYVTRFFGQRMKVKNAVIDAAYVDMPRVLALKKLGARVIEMQHGTINDEHHGYQIYNDFNKLLFPDKLLCFGSMDKDFFKSSTYIDYNDVFEVGSYYLEYINNSNPISEQYESIRKNHPLLIAITGQDAYDDVLIEFINEVLEEKPEWGVIFIPRTENENFYRKKYELNNNIHFVNNLNTYELIKLCDIHTTVNSTCALESVAIGTPNVLFDYNKKASSYLSHLLTDLKSNSFCTTAKEFVLAVENEHSLIPEEVLNLNSSLFALGYSNNLKSFFKSVS